MSDYKRFVSYIYGYEQGEKRENTGFVKVNARGDECKIWVHVKGFYSHRQRPYRVYVFTQKRERLEGQYLGELESRNGALEWNGVTRTDSLMGGFSLDESRGIYIEGENRVFAAEWDDYPVDVDRFEPLERSARQRNVEENTGKDNQSSAERVAERPKQEEQTDLMRNAGMNFQMAQAARLKPEPEPEQISKPWTELETESEPEPLQAAQLKTDWTRQEQEKKRAQTEPEMLVPEDPRRRQWEYLVSHFPAVRYQDGGGDILSGIRLGNRELSRIPRDKWGLGNNSFLLHGFYQHHHLLLFRKQTERQISYYIGVPGIYNEKEQMLASMFGFEEFKVMKGPDAQTQIQAPEESFGYWCRLLK